MNNNRSQGFSDNLAVTLKVENIQKDSLDSIPSPSPLVKIQIIGIVNKLLETKSQKFEFLLKVHFKLFSTLSEI